jgi:L-cysteine desulfidase
MVYTIKDILRLEVAPALGCTEPAAVALGAAAAAALLPDRNIDSIELELDPNIYKNGLAVAIPGARGAAGIDLAAALGAFGGDPSRRLQALETVTPESLKQAETFVREGRVHIDVLRDRRSLFVKTRIRSGERTAESEISDLHDNIVSLSIDGRVLSDHPLLAAKSREKSDVREAEAWLAGLTLEKLVALLDGLDADDLAFLKEGIDCNMKLAEYGLAFGPGLGVGLTLERLVREGLLKKDMITAAKILASAAADARMSGVELPAMSSSGSGNHGLTAILPVRAVRDYIADVDETRLLRAVGLSHVITAYIKAHTGRLTAVCGCSIAAGAGATAGIAYLMGGNVRHIAGAIKNVVGDLAGVICDGAKAGCALKLATAAGNAVQSALFSLHGLDIKGTDGIVAHSPEDTMKNLGELSTQGMIEADRTILDIMIRKRFDVP